MTSGGGIAARRRRLAMLAAIAATGAHAEVVIQGGQILPGPAIEVPAAAGESRGANLFHSFQVFNVLGGLGESVTFTGPEGVKNVVSRVTGGTSEITGLKSSLIDGPVAVAIPGANFYFINPHGVVFGEFGSVQADGSVHIATADAVRFQDGAAFYADPGKTSTLTTAPPSAFGFLGPSPAPIEMNGPWMGAPYTPAPVPPGKTFTLVGGDIEIRAGAFGGGAIVAPGATVSLASVASAGDAKLAENGPVDLSGFEALGRVNVSGGSFVDVGREGAGAIYVRAGALTLAPGALLAETYSPDGGGLVDVGVRGDLTAATDPETGIVSIIGDSFPGDGAGPAIRLDVGGTLDISDGSSVYSEGFSGAFPGDIDIRAGTVRVRGLGAGEFTGISGENFGDASGPSVRIAAGNLEVLNGGYIGTRNYGGGTGGALAVQADRILLTGTGIETLGLSTETLGGAAGSLTVSAGTIELRDGARISASTGGFGDAGALRVAASKTIAVTGELSGIFSSVGQGATGSAGTVTVATPVLSIEGGVIDSSTVADGDAGDVDVQVDELRLTAGGQIRSFSGGVRVDENGMAVLDVGTGSAGTVTVAATRSISASGTTASGAPSGLLAQTRGPGAGGDVQVTTPLLVLSNRALIGADTGGTGSGGSVLVSVGDADLSGGARISSGSGITVLGLQLPAAGEPGGDGGTVQVAATGSLQLSGAGTAIAANTRTSGRGGDVAVAARNLTISNGATISSSSTGTGLAGDVSIALGDGLTMRAAGIETQAVTSDGGNIRIALPGLIDMIDSRITTSVESGEGGGGNIAIARPQFVVLQRSQIIANAFGGPGGNIDIAAGQLITDPASVIEASSALGIDGIVNIDAPNPDVGSNLVVLPESFLDVAGLLQPTCGAARAGLSSLVQVGRGGLPADPDGYLPSAGASAPPVPAAGNDGAAQGARGAATDRSIVLANLSCSR